jgi:tetratricopeptide (TPR) repeat protein
LIAALLMLIAGCAGVKTGTSSESAAAAAQEQPAPVESENKAVIALLDLAHTDNEAGRREAAGASLERALRIEPRNPWLWHELAQLRLTQGQYEQAISMARKSNSFAGQDRRLQALNWRAIGDARVAQGDSAGAEQALKQAAELEQSQ